MPVRFSRQLLNSLPAPEREGLEEYLWGRSGGACHLCEDPFNRARDTIEADHDIPLEEGGPATRDNLKLAHRECNAAKRNVPTVEIRPLLRLKAFMRRGGHPAKYGDLAAFFGITPRAIGMTRNGDVVTFEFPDGTTRSATVMREQNGRQTYESVFLDVPRDAIINDERCQPRTIKFEQVTSIYLDLQRNPLHEAPGCRIEADAGLGMVRLLMFDGQHKTTAVWLAGRQVIPVKIYLNLEPAKAIELVNSVQAKIKKLPLSPFELAAKMTDEWQAKLAEYEARVGADNASEDGFIRSLPVADRSRGKSAFKAALVQNVLSDPELRFRSFLEPSPGGAAPLITENAFKSKFLERLLNLKPQTAQGEAGNELRTRERANIVRLLNILFEKGFSPAEGLDELSPAETARRRRMAYQSSLGYIASMLRAIFAAIRYSREERALLDVELTEDEWVTVREAVQRLVDHPVWTAALDLSDRMRNVESALSRNQDARLAFEAVSLRCGCLMGVETVPGNAVTG